MPETIERRTRPRTTTCDHAFDDVRKLLREANEATAQLQETASNLHTTVVFLQSRYDSACEVILQYVTGGTIERAKAMVERYRERRGYQP